MVLQINNPGPPLTEADILALEGRLSLALPELYRRFLLDYNGGEPEPAEFQFKHEHGPYTDSTVEYFFSVGGVPDNRSFDWNYNLYKVEEDRLPHNMVPIAHDPGGNLICISMAGIDAGAVFFWDHEAETEPPSYENLHLVADDFQEFLNGLYTSPEYVQSDAQIVMHHILLTEDITALENLLAAGWDVDTKDDLGLSMLERVACINKVRIAKLLLQHGAEPERALDIALRANAALHTYDEMVQILQAHSPNPPHYLLIQE